MRVYRPLPKTRAKTSFADCGTVQTIMSPLKNSGQMIR